MFIPHYRVYIKGRRLTLADIQERAPLNFESVWAMFQETDKRFRETEKAVQETTKAVRELSLEMKESGRRMFNALGYHFNAVSPGGLCIYEPGGQALAEVDLLLQNTENMMAVEIKTKPQERDVDELLKRLETLRAWADETMDRRKKILGALAEAIVTQAVRQYALKAGLYVIVQSGDTMKIVVPEGFVPRQW